MRRIVEVGHDQRWRCWFPRISTTILKYSFSIESGWEFIKENKNSTKKVIKKKRKFFPFFLGRFLIFLIAFSVEFLFSFLFSFFSLTLSSSTGAYTGI